MPEATIISPMAFRYAGREPRLVQNFQTALLDAAKRAASLLNPTTLRKGDEVLRAVGRKGDLNGTPKFTIEQARELPPDSSERANRWSGAMLLSAGRKVQHGALYVSQDLNGFLNESMRYSRTKDVRSIPWQGGRAEYFTFGPATREYSKLQATNVYYRYKLQHSIDLLDLTPEHAAQFYARIEGDPDYMAAKKDMRIHQELPQMILDKFDYTATLPLGLSILLAQRTAGLRVRTAQNEIDIAGDGFNAVLGGSDGKAVSYLEPAGTLIAGLTGSKQSLIKSDSTDLTRSSGIIVPGSLIDLPSE